MMTTLLRSQTLASLPNSRLKTPMVPGPHTSCVMRTSALTQTLSPAWTLALPAARARIFSVNVIIVASVQRQVFGHLGQEFVFPTFLAENGLPELGGVGVENHLQGGGVGEPGPALHLVLKLARTPASVTDKHPD